jgi:peptidoglycan/xylan/chitin deacetylase (PgdA/CDA1 family)
MILRIVTVTTLISLVLTGATMGAVKLSINATDIHLLWLGVAEFILIQALLLYSIFESRAPVFGRVFWRGPKHLPAISLTFDDGPNEPYTSQILDVLDTFNIKATFFVIGKNASLYPNVVKREIEQGHEVGNHSWSHRVLVLKQPDAISQEIRMTSDLIETISGTRPTLFRAPHGWRNPWVNRVAKEAGTVPVAWSLGVWDTDRPGADVIVRRTLKGLHNGCVLLLHDGRGVESAADSSQLVGALEIIIKEARKAGYRFLKLSEMMQEAGAV